MRFLMEQAAGADREQVKLRETLTQIRSGDTLVVVHLDRLARSLSDPIYSSSALGTLMLLGLGALGILRRT